MIDQDMIVNCTPHSMEWINDSRLDWWHSDFLDNLIRTTKMSDAKSLIEFGVGQGHWVANLLPHLKHLTKITGVDKERFWVDAFLTYFAAHVSFSGTTTAVQHDVHLPLNNNQLYDIATCQTLLMHCHNPKKALENIIRCINPGGSLLVAEPINLFSRLSFGSAWVELSVRQRALIFEFWSYYHEGLKLNAQGDHDIASYLLGLFDSLDLTNILIRQNDKVFCIHNDDSSEVAFSKEYQKESVQSLVLKGGGSQQLICETLNAVTALIKITKEQCKRKEYSQTILSNVVIATAVKG